MEKDGRMGFSDAFECFPELETERLILREIILDDASNLLALYSDPMVVQYLDWDGITQEDEARMMISLYGQQYRQSRSIRWAIADKAGNSLIGTFLLTDFFAQKVASIGYDLAQEKWRKGFLTESLDVLLPCFHNELNLERIQAFVHPENHASCKMMDRIGFEQEGLLRKEIGRAHV